MRLSDVKGERTLDVIADIIEPIANIAEDKEAAALFRREKLPDGADARTYTIRRLKKGVPALVKSHKNDIITILSSIEGTSREAYTDKLDLLKLIRDFTELITDEAFTGLFISAQSGDSSGSALESTEGHEV